jgi:hypothetical protein
MRLVDLGFNDIVFTDSRGKIYDPRVDNIEGYCHIHITISLEEFNIKLPSLCEWLVYMKNNNNSMPYININFSEFVDVSIDPYFVPNWHGINFEGVNENVEEHPIRFVFVWRGMLIRNEKDISTINQEESHNKIKEVLDRYDLQFDMSYLNQFYFGIKDTNLEVKENSMSFDDVKESVKNQKIEKVLLEFFPEEICEKILEKCSNLHKYQLDYESYMKIRNNLGDPNEYIEKKRLYEEDMKVETCGRHYSAVDYN